MDGKLLARLGAAVLATTRDLDARGTAAAQGATGTGAWLRVPRRDNSESIRTVSRIAPPKKACR